LIWTAWPFEDEVDLVGRHQQGDVDDVFLERVVVEVAVGEGRRRRRGLDVGHVDRGVDPAVGVDRRLPLAVDVAARVGQVDAREDALGVLLEGRVVAAGVDRAAVDVGQQVADLDRRGVDVVGRHEVGEAADPRGRRVAAVGLGVDEGVLARVAHAVGHDVDREAPAVVVGRHGHRVRAVEDPSATMTSVLTV
jgi:hypothetical protein